MTKELKRLQTDLKILTMMVEKEERVLRSLVEGIPLSKLDAVDRERWAVIRFCIKLKRLRAFTTIRGTGK